MEKDEVDIIDYLKVIWKRKIMIVAIVISTTITSAIVNLLLPRIYEALAIVRVGKYIISVPYMDNQEGRFRIEEPIENVKETCKILESPFIKDKVRAKLKILKKNLQDKDIIITRLEDTNLIEIKARAKEPELAKEIGNTVVNLLLEYHQDIIKKKEDMFKNRGLIIGIEPSVVIVPAGEPLSPIRPRIILNIITVTILSLIVGTGVAFIKENI